MKLLEARICGFGKFRERAFRFSEGLNVVYGYNEAGKSTLHAFLCAMLYGFPQKPRQADLSQWYLPWDGREAYGGELCLSCQGEEWRLGRDFRPDGREPLWVERLVQDKGSGERLAEPQSFLSEVLGGITETAFRNTVAIGQLKAATDREMVRELQGYIGNMQTSHDSRLNADKALALLSAELQELEGRRMPGAAKEYAALVGEERRLEREIAAPKYENLLSGLSLRQAEASAALSKGRERRDALLRDLEQDRESLRQAGFLDDAAADRRNAEMDAAFGRHRRLLEKDKAGRGGRLSFLLFLPAVLFLLLACLGIAGAADPRGGAFQALGIRPLLSRMALPEWLLCILLFLLSLLFFCLGTVRILEGRRTRAELRDAEEEIRKMADPALGDSALPIGTEMLESYHQYMAGIKEGLGRLRENGQELSRLNEELAGLSQREEQCQEEIAAQQALQAELEGKLRHLANVQNRAALLERTLSENERLEREAEAIRMAMERMGELRESMKRSFGAYLNRDLGEVLSRLTGGAYDSIWLDDRLKIYLNTGDRMLPMERTSTGTIDQIYLALRLSCARFLQEGLPERLPLLLDDSFAMYDEKRLKDALCFLREAYQGQVILFTCQRRERQILEEAGIPFQYIAL